MEKIDKIIYQDFRGIIKNELDLQGKSLILYGENGTGKSSLIDGVEFFTSGKIRNIDGIESLQRNRQDYITHKNGDPSSTKVEIISNGRSASRTYDNLSSSHDGLLEEIKKIETPNMILRRNQILNFINSAPGDRFRFISDIIGISSLDGIELNMKRARETYKNEIETMKRSISSLKGRVTVIASSQVAKTLDELEDFIKRSLVEEKITQSVVEDISEASTILKSLIDPSTFDDIKKKESLLEDMETLQTSESGFKSLHDDLTQLEEKHKEFISKYGSKIQHDELLKIAKSVLNLTKPKKCPVCINNINFKEVITSIDDRLALNIQLSQEGDVFVELINTIFAKVDDVYPDEGIGTSDKIDLFIRDGQIFPDLTMSEQREIKMKLEELDTSIQSKIKELTEHLTNYKKIVAEIDYKHIKEIATSIQSHIKEINSILSRHIKVDSEILGSEENKYNTIEKYVLLIDKYNDWNRSINTLRPIESMHQLASDIFDEFVSAKLEKIESIYETTQTLVEEYYQKLHRFEKDFIGPITLKVDPDRRASMILNIDIFEMNADPRALCSEGHLDSLGIAIFLAFFKTYHNHLSFFFLDDVVTSIDSKHRKLLADLIFSEFSDKQKWITTHNYSWFEDMKKIIEKRESIDSRDYAIRVIDSWHPDNGMIIVPDKNRWEIIQSNLTVTGKSIAGNNLRSYMEGKIKKLAENVQVPVSYKRKASYGFAELFNLTEIYLKEKLQDGDAKNDLLVKFENYKAHDTYTNILSHDDVRVSDVSVGELSNFVNETQELLNSFICEHCSRMVKKLPRTSRISCSPPDGCSNPILWTSV